jgi:acetyl-CoA carboxylase carboxyl transferase subunit alpha
VMLIGHHKGHTSKEKIDCFFGCAHPEGYRKALNRCGLPPRSRCP